MPRRLAPAALAAFALLALPPGTAPGGAADPADLAALERHLEALLGAVPAEATLVVHGPGAPPARTVPWAELRAALAATSLGGAPPPEPDGPVPGGQCTLAGAPLYCGPDAGYGYLQPAPFCDTSSGWVLYQGAPPGAAFIESRILPIPTPPICGGFFGPSSYYEFVELSPTKDERVALGMAESGWEGCYSSVWKVHANGYCPHALNRGGYGNGALDTFVAQWRLRGPAIAMTLHFPERVYLDYVLGLGGTTCSDLPAGAVVDDVTCP